MKTKLTLLVAVVVAAVAGLILLRKPPVSEPSRATPTISPTNQSRGFGRLADRPLEPAAIERFATGFSGLHGLGVVNGSLYVSSWPERVIYRLDQSGNRERLAGDLGGAHDMVADGSGLVTPLFQDNRLVRIENGSTRTIAQGLAGPNGVAGGPDGTFFVSNARSGTVVSISRDGRFQTIASALQEPAGLLREADGGLLVAQFGDTDRSVVRLKDGAVTTVASGLAQAESLLADAQGNVIVGHTISGRVAFSLLIPGASQPRPILQTDLLGPTVGPVSDGQYLYFQALGEGSSVFRIRLP